MGNRETLRIYDFDGPADRVVAVRFFKDDASEAAVETQVTLRTFPAAVIDPVYPEVPGYAQIGNFVRAFPELVGASRVRIEILPVTPGLRFWAFVSVTNNETQHVTAVLPK